MTGTSCTSIPRSTRVVRAGIAAAFEDGFGGWDIFHGRDFLFNTTVNAPAGDLYEVLRLILKLKERTDDLPVSDE